jgi:hypothetical protein
MYGLYYKNRQKSFIKIKWYSNMASLTGQFFYHLVVNNIAPILASSAASISSSYFSSRSAPPLPTLIRTEVDDERELDLLQMERMLKWMSLIFEDSIVPIDTPGDTSPKMVTTDDTHKAYKKELYSIYITICSDFSQYQNWKKYNANIWMFSSYRNKNTKDLARKILGDVKLFHEGLKMFSMFEKLQN